MSPLKEPLLVRFLVMAALLTVWAGFSVGCGSDESAVTSGGTTGLPAESGPQVVPDDSVSVTTLEMLGAKFKRGGDGRVTEVNLRGVELTDADLAPLPLLANLQSVLLNETAVTDEGLKTLGFFCAGVATVFVEKVEKNNLLKT